jgi:hypothetical protein
MSEPAALERRCRRLLAWYPQPFRSEHEEEMLAVLMAGARPGQRRPGVRETADVIRAALGMRLRPVRSGPANRGRADALTAFSLVAPLFVVVASFLEVVLPYHLRTDSRFPVLAQMISRQPEVGGLSLLTPHGLSFRSPATLHGHHFPGVFAVHPGFDIAVGGQVIIAVLVLLGLRRAALAAIALYWFLASYLIPQPLQLLIISVYLLEAAALIASPGLRRGRPHVNWRQGLILLLAAAAVQASTLWLDAATSSQASAHRSRRVTW